MTVQELIVALKNAPENLVVVDSYGNEFEYVDYELDTARVCIWQDEE